MAEGRAAITNPGHGIASVRKRPKMRSGLSRDIWGLTPAARCYEFSYNS